MENTYSEILANQYLKSRNSTLKRLNKVPMGFEHWRPTPNSMSFTDTAVHLLEVDNAYLDSFDSKIMGKCLGRATTDTDISREDFENLLLKLEKSAAIISNEIKSKDYSFLSESIEIERIAGNQRVSYFALFTTAIDSEAHHRGELVVYLKLLPSP